MLKKISIKAIQVRMSKALEKLFQQSVYGISDIIISDGGTQLSRKACSGISESYLKKFKFEEQTYQIVSNKLEYVKEMNNLTKTFLNLRNLKKKLLLNWETIKAANKEAKHLQTLLGEAKISLETVLEQLKIYKSVDLTKKNKPFVGVITKFKLENYFEKLPQNVIQNIGATSTSPALDCSQVREVSKNKKSGFYFIQPVCSKYPLRVFCDFSILPQGMAFYIFNNNQQPNTRLETIKLRNANDVRYQCATQGLFPIEIRNKDTTKRIAQLLSAYGWNLANPLVIPLGYDYNCDHKNCIKQYNSFNRDDSKPVLPFLFKSKNANSIKNAPAQNSIGYGYDKDGAPTIFDLKNANVTALVCSTNNFVTYDDPSIVRISCIDNLYSNPRLDVQINNEIKVKCPSFCAQNSEASVIGTGKYSGRSSICQAAIHAGIIKNMRGGVFKLKVIGQEKVFSGTNKNGINSLPSMEPSRKTFIAQKHKEKCPMDYLKHLVKSKSSFLEIKNGALNELEVSELEELKTRYEMEQNFLSALTNGISTTANAANNAINNVGSAVNSAANAANNAVNNVGSAVNNAANAANNAVNSAANVANNVGAAVNNAANSAANAANNAINNAGAAVNNAVNNAANAANNAVNNVGAAVNNAANNAANAANNAVNNVGAAVNNLANNAANAANNAVNNAGAAVNNAVNNVANAATGALNNAANAATGALNNAANAATGALNNAANAANNAVNSGLGAITNVGNAVRLGANGIAGALGLNGMLGQGGNINASQSNGQNQKKKKYYNLKTRKPCDNNTDAAIKTLGVEKKRDYKELQSFSKFGKFVDKVISKFSNELSFARAPSQLSLDILKKSYSNIRVSLTKLQKLIKRILSKANSRLEYTKYIKEEMRIKLKSLFQSEGYIFNYKDYVKKWKVQDNKSSAGGPSSWVTIDTNINSRKIALLQSSKIESHKGKYASFFILKKKVFHDFTFNLDIMVRSDKSCGVLFRVKDIYNFYSFEVNQSLGIKKLVKVENGRYKVIQTIRDGGITQNQWFKVQIVTRLDNIQIGFGDAKSYGKYSALPRIFNVIDPLIRQGSVGLFTNGNDKFYADNIKVKTTPCWGPWQPNPTSVKIINSRANIFEENYKGDVSQKYKQIDPKNSSRGPAEWGVKRNFYGREICLSQTSEIRDKSPERDHAMYIIKNKFLKNGSFSVDFLAEKAGVVGLIFKYSNPDNYLLFEIGGFSKNKRFFQIRKRLNGMKSIVQRANTKKEVKSSIFGYSQYIWYRVRIENTETTYKIYISIPGQKENLIFEGTEKDFTYGLVGISTSFTSAGFDNISIKPRVAESKTSFLSNSGDGGSEDDLFGYDSDEIMEKEDKIENIKSQYFHRYQICLKNKTPDTRKLWCSQTFGTNTILKKKCNTNYCNICCEKNVPAMQQLDLYHCKKSCKSISVPSNSIATTSSWNHLCFNSPNPDRNLYSYCENSFGDIVSRQNCKIDGCRMCCVNSDNMLNTDMSIDSMNACFSKCAREFSYNPDF